MDYKDCLGNEIKDIYKEETKDISLSSSSIENIISSRKIGLREKINIFLNKEIEIPLAPAIVGLVVVVGISFFPKSFPTDQKIEIIKINGSQIIVRAKDEVAKR